MLALLWLCLIILIAGILGLIWCEREIKNETAEMIDLVRTHLNESEDGGLESRLIIERIQTCKMIKTFSYIAITAASIIVLFIAYFFYF